MTIADILILVAAGLAVVGAQFWLRSNHWMYRASIVPTVVRSLQFIILMLIGVATWCAINGG